MNVLIATYLVPSSPSGVVTYYQTLASDLTAAGVDIHIVDASHTPTSWRKFLGVLKRIMRAMGGAPSVIYDEFAYFTGIYLAARKLRGSTFDLIHAQDARSGVAAYLALGNRVPIILTCHFNDDPVRELVQKFTLKPVFTRRLTSWYTYLFSYIHTYVFVSNYAYTQSKHLLPSGINKSIIPNTVRLTSSPQPDCPNTIDRQKLIISNVGYIDERKNQKLLLQLGHELRSQGISNFHLWLIGDGPKLDNYKLLATELGLNDHVTFFGRQASPWLLVAQSDLYIHTALNDNCPYSIIEAFAVRTPVLALPIGGIPEMLPKGFGELNGATICELASEVSQYFNPTLRQQLINAQATNYALVFNHSANFTKLLSVYRQTVEVSSPVPDYSSFEF
ncbi:glycosyltransferase [Spirosoma sp. HMF4905]|uniref:Glycosyltransferase n=1 Tax=Spirosoma arboris TaxID=2682092 RepID=A0A7K1SNX6_9BACT|nr:glycosyltransferase family 4 protein [Spirosoma arboris]MVM35512.1 glycosyltransferase [Spirosoma arboris]